MPTKEKTRINSITVGALPENTDRAAALAATAALSLSAKFQSLPSASPAGVKIFRSLQVEIQTKMEHVFVNGGSDLGATKDAMFVYLLNKNRDMSLVMVTPLKKDWPLKVLAGFRRGGPDIFQTLEGARPSAPGPSKRPFHEMSSGSQPNESTTRRVKPGHALRNEVWYYLPSITRRAGDRA
jgi:hypothetical protein